MSSTSKSLSKRTEGNKFFEQAKKSTDPNIKIINIISAINSYELANKEATNDEETYKSLKNISLSYNLYSEILKENDLKDSIKLNEYMTQLKMLFKSVLSEIDVAKTYFNLDEYDEFDERFIKIEETLDSHINTLLSIEKYNEINILLEILKQNDYLYTFFILKVCNYFFEKGNNLFKNKKYEVGKEFLEKSINVYLDISKNKDEYNQMKFDFKDKIENIYEESNILIKEIKIFENIDKAEIYILKEINDKNISLNDYTNIKLIIDNYKTAFIVYLNENKITNINTKDYYEFKDKFLNNKLIISLNNIFQNDKISKFLGEQIIDLLSDISNINQTYLFQTIKNKIFNFKNKINDEEKKSENKEKINIDNNNKEEENELIQFNEFKKKNEEIFKNLKKQSEKGLLDFVKYILEKYPFIGYDIKKFNVRELYIMSKRNLLKKLCVYYHPDKYSKVSQKEKEKYFIMQEICKYVTTKYNEVKD